MKHETYMEEFNAELDALTAHIANLPVEERREAILTTDILRAGLGYMAEQLDARKGFEDIVPAIGESIAALMLSMVLNTTQGRAKAAREMVPILMDALNKSINRKLEKDLQLAAQYLKEPERGAFVSMNGKRVKTRGKH